MPSTALPLLSVLTFLSTESIFRSSHLSSSGAEESSYLCLVTHPVTVRDSPYCINHQPIYLCLPSLPCILIVRYPLSVTVVVFILIVTGHHHNSA
jgi:hypothetical protein